MSFGFASNFGDVFLLSHRHCFTPFLSLIQTVISLFPLFPSSFLQRMLLLLSECQRMSEFRCIINYALCRCRYASVPTEEEAEGEKGWGTEVRQKGVRSGVRKERRGPALARGSDRDEKRGKSRMMLQGVYQDGNGRKMSRHRRTLETRETTGVTSFRPFSPGE